MRRVALLASFASVAAILFSIALSQVLLGVALVMVLRSKEQLRFPPIRTPLLLFFLWTLLSASASGHFEEGLPQIRKFFVFATLLVVCSTFRSVTHVTRLVATWAMIAVGSSILAFGQLWTRYRQAHAEGAAYYEFFLDARLHGFASHWMTFGGELLVVSLLLLSVVLWHGSRRFRIFAALCLPLLWASLVLGLTRSVFLVGVPAGALYLATQWRRWALLLVPAVLIVSAFLMPFQVRERIVSVIYPHGNDDSNLRRVILSRTGLAMIRAHPILGLGPEQVGKVFLAYVPPDILRPLPKGWYGHLHNIYLQFAAERGLPALFFLLWIIARMLRDFATALGRRELIADRWVLQGVIGVVIGVLAEGFFEHNLGDSEVLTMFLATVSLGYVVIWQAAERARLANLVNLPTPAARLIRHA